jgi:multiple antibiotic resistance protein
MRSVQGNHHMQVTPQTLPPLALSAIFTFFFVTLGPAKLLGPFAQATHDMDEPLLRQVATRTFLVGLIAALAGGIAGSSLLGAWQISLGAITIAGGLIFLLVGLRQVLEQYTPKPDQAMAPLPAKPLAAAFRLAFPLVVTPYGLAAIVAILANSASLSRTGAVVGIVTVVMILNLLGMLFIRKIMASLTVAMILQILGAVLAVLQVALAVQVILRGLRELGVLSWA